MTLLDDVRRFTRQEVGLDLSGVRDAQLERRVANFLRRNGLEPSGLIRALSDDALLDRFLDGLTINVTSLYRNAERWGDIAELLPTLGSRPRLWSAGCSKGAEAYTMAILCDLAGVRADITATDVDTRILAAAVEGVFTAQEVREVPPEVATRYLTALADGTHRIDGRVARRVTFARQDLLAGPFPTERYDLIACRNVAIYFSVEAKRALHASLAACLAPGGYLFIGSTERVEGPGELGLTSVAPFIYRSVIQPVGRTS